MILDSNIIYLLALWFLGWGFYYFTGKKKMSIVYNTDFVTVYFFFLAAVSFLIGQRNFPDFITHNIFFYFAVVLFMFIIINHIYFIINEKFKEPLSLVNEHPTDKWLEANRQSIFVTLAHILFQQIVITSIILFLWNRYFNLHLVIWYFVVIFGLMHILIAPFKGFRFMVLYTFPAMLAAAVFPVLLINLHFAGFVLNYVIHASFYVVLTYIFWRNEGRADTTQMNAQENFK